MSVYRIVCLQSEGRWVAEIASRYARAHDGDEVSTPDHYVLDGWHWYVKQRKYARTEERARAKAQKWVDRRLSSQQRAQAEADALAVARRSGEVSS